MATFLETVAHSVERMSSLYYVIFVILAVSRFSLKGNNVVLITPASGHCLPFTKLYMK